MYDLRGTECSIAPLLIAAGIAGGATLAGGVIGNRSRSKEAAKNRAFQERMRNTQWQAGVADMEAAGLNPALAYGQGGAASPSGSMASQDDVISGAVNSAQDARRLTKELKQMDEQRLLTTAQKYKADQDGRESRAREDLMDKQRTGVGITNELSRLSLFSARNVAAMEQTKLGQILPYMERIMGLAPRINLGAFVGGRGARRTKRPNRSRMTTMQTGVGR